VGIFYAYLDIPPIYLVSKQEILGLVPSNEPSYHFYSNSFFFFLSLALSGNFMVDKVKRKVHWVNILESKSLYF
jgi:hypothetical protein